MWLNRKPYTKQSSCLHVNVIWYDPSNILFFLVEEYYVSIFLALSKTDLGGVSVKYKTVTSPFLTIYSEGYPSVYDEDINATIHLTAQDTTHRILVATRDFDVEANYDFVTFYEGHDKTNVIAELSGLLPNQVVMSQGNEMTIEFISDYLYGYRGFWLEAESQHATQGIKWWLILRSICIMETFS